MSEKVTLERGGVQVVRVRIPKLHGRGFSDRYHVAVHGRRVADYPLRREANALARKLAPRLPEHSRTNRRTMERLIEAEHRRREPR